LKKVCETEIGLPTQCVDWNKAMDQRKGGGAYQANLALKMNAKLGGQNTAVYPKLPVVAEQPTLVLGADVHHPSVGNTLSPSIAAIVGSYDISATRYATVIQQQGHRVESIAGMEQAVFQLLDYFRIQNKLLPQRIIMYRDGVGEGGFDEVMTREVRAIQRACSKIQQGFKPVITFLLVQKRHHVRFFAEQDRDCDKDGRLLAGTVFDSGVTSPHDFDFFLCSHAGLKGTSKATHYHVLYDEAKLDSDKMLALTFALCHVYARCNRSVSIPAPAYYAHLAAYRARLYMPEDDGGKGQLPEVKLALRSRLYYC